MAIIKKSIDSSAGEGVGKRDPPALLVWMYIGTTTVENSKEAPEKTKNRVTMWSVVPTLSIYLGENIIWKNTCTQNS